jgi:hypothetical protein
MKTLLVGFGDSWTFGSELDRPQEQSWVVHLANRFEADYINLGTPASSIEHTVVQLFDYIKDSALYADYKKIFMVGLTGTTRYLSYSNTLDEFVNITPEANYRTGDIHHSGRPPEVVKEFSRLSGEMYRMVESLTYNQYIATKTIFTFQNYCQQNNIDVLFFSYFDQVDVNPKIVNTELVYPITITEALTGQEYSLPEIRENQYFEGKLFHPNTTGHIQIARLLKNFYDQKYPRN